MPGTVVHDLVYDYQYIDYNPVGQSGVVGVEVVGLCEEVSHSHKCGSRLYTLGWRAPNCNQGNTGQLVVSYSSGKSYSVGWHYLGETGGVEVGVEGEGKYEGHSGQMALEIQVAHEDGHNC